MKRTSFGSLKRLFACLSVTREVVSCLLPGSLDLSFQKFALGHATLPLSHLLLRANVRWHDNYIRRRQTITVQFAFRLDGFTYGEVTEGGRLRRFGVGLQIILAFGEGCAVRNQNGESLIFGLHGDG